jgi:hypothetical protein
LNKKDWLARILPREAEVVRQAAEADSSDRKNEA